MSPKSVFVTGASKGIGLELVRQFLKDQHPAPECVIAACRSPAAAADLVSLKEQHPHTLHIVQYDVADPQHHKRLASEVEALLPESGLNLLINNAGVTSITNTFMQVTTEEMLDTFKTNTVGPLMTVQALYKFLEKAAEQNSTSPMGIDRATVLNISSLAGSIGQFLPSHPGFEYYPYRVSKAGLNMVTKNLAEEIGKKGILVLSLCPGYTITDLTRSTGTQTTQESAAKIMKVLSGLDESHQGRFLSNEINKPYAF